MKMLYIWYKEGKEYFYLLLLNKMFICWSIDVKINTWNWVSILFVSAVFINFTSTRYKVFSDKYWLCIYSNEIPKLYLFTILKIKYTGTLTQLKTIIHEKTNNAFRRLESNTLIIFNTFISTYFVDKRGNTLRPRQRDAIFQTPFSNVFSWTKCINCDRNLIEICS